MEYDVVTVGGGPVGIFSAFQAGMLGMKICVIDAEEKLGGQCSILYPEKPIYDIPGFIEIEAGKLIENLIQQAKKFNPQFLLKTKVLDIKRSENHFIIITSQTEIKAKAVLIAAGTGEFTPNKPPIPYIQEYENLSVFYNVTNKNAFRSKTIMIAGGGDSAVDWCIELLPIAKKIFLLHRRKSFRASPANIAKLNHLLEQYPQKINIISPFQLDNISGKNGTIEHVVLKDLADNKITINVDSMLLFFGLVQNIGTLANIGVNMKGHTMIVNPSNYQTNIEGIYAIGDVATYEGKIKLILSGFAEASAALYHMYPRVFNNKSLHFEYSTTKLKKSP